MKKRIRVYKAYISKNYRFLVYTIFGVLILIAVYNSWRLRFIVDDAYIGMRYARHLAEGKGLVYNIGERVEGYTNFLWIIILALFGLFGFNLPTTSIFLGILFNVLTLILVFKLMNKINSDKIHYNLIPIIFLSNNLIFLQWGTGGMGTSFFIFLVFSLAYLFYTEVIKKKTFQLSPVLSAVLILAKVEGIVFVLAYFIAMALFLRKEPKYKKKLLIWCLIFGIIIIPYLLWKYFYYGDIIPNAAYNKVNKLYYFSRGFYFFSSFFVDEYFYLLIIPPLFFIRKSKFTSFILFMIFTHIFFTIWVGGDWMGYRFYAPIIPLVMVCFGYSISRILELKKWRNLTQNEIRATTIFFLIISFYLVSKSTYNPSWEPIFNSKQFKQLFNYKLDDILLTIPQMNIPEEKAIEVAEAYEKVLDKDDVIAATFAGFTAFYTDHKVIDMLGLTDSYIAKLPVTSPGTPGHEKWAPREYLEANNVVAIFPGVEYNPGSENDARYFIQYENNKYFVFESLLSKEDVIKKFSSKGFPIYYHGEKIYDPYNYSVE